MKNEKKKALVYCRVSTYNQEEKGTSLDSQASECIKFAEENDFQVTNIVKETYSGAYLFDRPLLNIEREKVKKGEYDAVIVYAIDRLSRDIAHLSIITEEFERAETKLMFVSEVFDTTAEGKLMQSIKGYVAQIEREKIRERTSRGKRTKALSGKLINASDLYGYVTDKVNCVRIIVESEALIIKRIYQEYIEGKSIRAIIKDLNEDKIPSPASNKRNFKNLNHYTNLAKHGRTLWGKGAIRRILTESAYCGKSYSLRYKANNGYEKGKRYTRIITLPEEEWIALPDSVSPQIITPEMFQTVKQRLDSRTNADKTRNQKKPYLLRGLVYCGTCGVKMYPEVEHGQRTIFRCPSRNTIKCGGKRINADKCEIAVWEEISHIIRDPQTIKLEFERRKKEGNNEQKNLEFDIQSINKTIISKDNEIKRLVNALALIDDDFIIQTFQDQLKLIKQNRDRVLAQLDNAEKRLAVFNSDIEGWESFISFSERISKNLESFGFDEKRVALKALGVKIIGNGKEIKLCYSFPTENLKEKQDIQTNHSSYRSARFWKNNACQTSSDNFATARI